MALWGRYIKTQYKEGEMTEKGEIIVRKTIIGKIIIRKGMKAAEMMDNFFCIQGCCPRTTLYLESAAKLMRKSDEELELLIEDLVKLPDIS